MRPLGARSAERQRRHGAETGRGRTGHPFVVAGVIEYWDRGFRLGRIVAAGRLYHFAEADFIRDPSHPMPYAGLAVDFMPADGVRTRQAWAVRVRRHA
jgi:hypothetical protein